MKSRLQHYQHMAHAPPPPPPSKKKQEEPPSEDLGKLDRLEQNLRDKTMDKVEENASGIKPTDQMQKQLDVFLPRDNNLNLKNQPLGDYSSLLGQMDKQLKTLGYAFESSTNQSKADVVKIQESNSTWQSIAPIGLLNQSKKAAKKATKDYNHRMSAQFY